MYRRYSQGWSKHLDFLLLDEAMLQVSFILACLLRLGSIPYRISIYRSMSVVMVMADLIAIIAFNTLHDVLKRGYYLELSATVKHCVLIFIFTSAFMFATQTGTAYSRITIALCCLFQIGIGFGTRLVWKHVIKTKGAPWMKDPATMVLVTEEERAEELLRKVSNYKYDARNITGLILRTACARKTIGGIPVLETLENAPDYICRKHIDSVYVDLVSSDPETRRLIDACREMAIPVLYHLPGMSRDGMKQFIERVGDTTVLTTTINYATPVQRLEKRAMDLLGGLVGSVMALIIMAVVGPMIKRQSPGPILYKQTRVGKNGKPFQMMKIRSMVMNADAMKEQLKAQNRIPDGRMFKLDWDPRIIGNTVAPDGTRKTGIGEFIRRTSLDEFPQFFNVLKGEMSLVGTRPPTLDEWNQYEFHHRARLACKPGMTGLWQVSGRSAITDFEEVVRLDTEYITRWTIGMDLRILFKTIGVLFTRKGAM